MFCKVYSAELWPLINLLILRKCNNFLVGSVRDLTLFLSSDSLTKQGLCEVGASPSCSPGNRGHHILDGGRRKRFDPVCFLFLSASPQQCFCFFTLVAAGGSIVICVSHRPRPRSQCSLPCLFSVLGVGAASYKY